MPRPLTQKLLLLFFVCSVAFADKASLHRNCMRWLGLMRAEEMQSALDLEKKEHRQKLQFLEDVFFPVVGSRALVGQSMHYRDITVTPDSIRLSGFRNHLEPGEPISEATFAATGDLILRWDPARGKDDAEVVYHADGTRELILPGDYVPGHFKRYPEALVKRLLLGHTLHPYTASKNAKAERKSLNEPEMLFKQVQTEGEAAVRYAVRNELPAFLFVASTGVGKTEILKAMLKAQIEKENGPRVRLHIVTAHMNNLVDSLHRAATEVASKTKEKVRIISQEEFRDMTFEDLIEICNKADKRGEHIVLATTTEAIQAKLSRPTAADLAKYLSTAKQPAKPKPIARTIPAAEFETMGFNALMQEIAAAEGKGQRIVLDTDLDAIAAKLDKRYKATIEGLQKYLGTFAIDEAHHAGAEGLSKIISDLTAVNAKRKKNKIFLYGTTATPFHEDRDILDLFGNYDFWAYVDTPHLFQKRLREGGTSHQKLETVLQQLEEAQYRGELHPFETTYLNPDANGGYFEKAGQRWRLKKDRMPELLDDQHLGPAIKDSKKTFFTVGSIDEANELTAAFATSHPGQRVAVLHSKLPNAKQILADFNEGKLDVLVTVKMIDEGYDVPDLTLYVDLTMYTGPRQLLQRIGRITRLSEGKTKPAQVIAFQRITDTRMAHVLQRLEAIGTGQPGQGGGGGGKPKKPPIKAQWTGPDLQKVPFWNKAVEERADANDEVTSMMNYFAGRNGPVNPFDARAIDVTSKQARDQLNLLDKALQDNEGGLHSAELNRILFNPPAKWSHATDGVETYRREWMERRQLLDSPEGTETVVIQFLKSTGRFPGYDRDGKGDTRDIEKFATNEEKRIIDAMKAHKLIGNADFLRRVLDVYTPSRFQYDLFRVDTKANAELHERWRALMAVPKAPAVAETKVERAPRPDGMTPDRVNRDIVRLLQKHTSRFDDSASGRPRWEMNLERLHERWADYHTELVRRDRLLTLESSPANAAALSVSRRKLIELEETLFTRENLNLLLEAAANRPGTSLGKRDQPMRQTMRDFTQTFDLVFP